MSLLLKHFLDAGGNAGVGKETVKVDAFLSSRVRDYFLTKTNHTCRFYSSIMQQFTWHVAARQKPTRPSKNFKRLLERLLLFWNLISATYPQSNALQTNSRGDMVLRFLSSEDDVDPSI